MKEEYFPQIRSYVLRQGKMTSAQREAYETLKDLYVMPMGGEGLFSLPEIFPGANRFVLEIGFGMGKATALIAEENPDTGYLGIEVHTPGVGKLLWEIREKKLSNIRIVQDDAVLFLRTKLKDDCLDGVHIFFPDPWPKKRHRKRRLVTTGFLNLLSSKVKSGGYIYIVTDYEDYAESILDSAADVEGLRNPYRGFAPPTPWRPETAFERKGRREEREIREVFFRKDGLI